METPASSADLWPYSERNGVFVADAVERLLADPETALTDTEKQAAYGFAADLLEGRYSADIHVTTEKSLERVSRVKAADSRQAYYTGYLQTAEGQAEVARLLPATAGGETSVSRPDALQHLRTMIANGEAVDPRLPKSLAVHSKKWYQKQLTERLLDDTVSAADAPDFEEVAINFEPGVLLEKSQGVQDYRTFYRAVKRELKQYPDSPLERAKRVLVDVHLARANAMLADLYSGAVQLAEQLDASPLTPLTEQWRQELYAVAPVISAAWKHDATKQQFSERFMERLDRVRNGVGLDESQLLSSVSHELLLFADGVVAKEAPASEFSPEVTAHLETTKWQAPQTKALLETVLAEWGWLSTIESEWHELDDRHQPAEDGKWQVIISPKADTLGVEEVKKVMLIPEDFDRPLLQQNPSGVLPVVSHELAHVVQAECDEVLAEHIPLAKMKGRRTLTGRELGGVQQESILLAHFGQNRNTNLNYLRALQTKLAGGNQTEVAAAHMQASIAGATATIANAANTAAKTSLRFYRHQGFNTQPLDYLEQAVMLEELRKQIDDDKIAAIAMASTSFSLHDSAALHQVGLLELPKHAPKQPAEDVLRIFFDRFYEPSQS